MTAPLHDVLRADWASLLERQPGLRIRDAAAELGVSEAELLATRVGNGVVRIHADVPRLLPRLEAVGRCMALTRNDLFVHEKVGVYRNVYVNPHVASVIDEAIDLRIFPARWRHGFAVADELPRGRRRSLQFFDAHGVAVHKIFLQEDADVHACDALVADLRHEDQAPAQTVAPPEAPAQPTADDVVDVAALAQDWRAMANTHDFHGLLNRHGVARTQALRLVPDELARPATNGGLREVLEGAAAQALPIMIFVNSPGTIQIHHGPVFRLEETPGWLNVLDPGFQLHARADDIGSTWVVRKPTERGWVTSVELYQADGTLAALLFGVRAAGASKNPAWRRLAEGLGAGPDAAGDALPGVGTQPRTARRSASP
jgi:putative hemin transport protein